MLVNSVHIPYTVYIIWHTLLSWNLKYLNKYLGGNIQLIR